MLLSYKPLHLEAQQRLQEEDCVVDINARLMAEGLLLMEEWHKLKVAINLGCHQRELDNAKAEVSLAASCEACSRAQEEAREADRRREVAEKPGAPPWSSKWRRAEPP